MSRYLAYLCSFLVAFAAFAARATTDVGIFDHLKGEVSVTSKGGNTLRATPFMKLRDGDRVAVAAGSQVQIVFFEARRRELWVGASSFKALLAGSEAVSGQPTKVSEVKGVPRRESLSYAANLQRMGGLTLRDIRPGVDNATITKAHDEYLLWSAAAAPDDILPELSMLGLLRERPDPALRAPYLEALKKKQPDREDVRQLLEQYQSRGAKP
jgi:hypothetical protein